MRYKYIIWIPMFLAFALATPSMGAFVSLGLPNGMSASVENNGGAAGSTTMSYEISDAGPLVDYIQGDILAVAHIDDELIGPGIATAQADAEDDLGDIVVNEADEDADLEISLKGEVNAYAQSSDAETTSDDGATVTSVGLIRAYAGAKELDDCGYPDRVFGDAQIYSGIGRFWTEDFEDADFGMGELIGEPEGMFFASANAEGAATYSALIGGEDEPTASVSGSTEGATTIEAAVGDEAGSIGGYLDGLEAEDPANAKLSSHSIADLPTYLDGGVWTKSTSKSRVELAAANDLSEPTSVGSYASGTAEGTTNGFAEVAGPNYDDIWITTSSTQIDDASNSADVNVLKNFDVAEAFSGLEVKSEADEYDAHVYSDAETDALVGRSFMYPGSDPNGKDRVGATAFIGSGSWNALADFTSTDLYDFQT